MKIQLATPLLLSSLLLVSCLSGNGGGGGPKIKSTEPLEIEMYGTYEALLHPINKDVSGHLNGVVSLLREEDNITIGVRVSGGPLSILHNQSIHVGSRCPNETDDFNNDGYIDAAEGAKVYNKILIPLDDDIGFQHIGGGIYPVSDQYGYYLWGRTTAYAKLLNDLWEDDINSTDDFTKLSKNQPLSIIGKVAIIMGVPETTQLPETVAGRGRLTPHQALPVACGIVRRLGVAPGRVDTDHTGIPVPHGETIGGSSGADDGAIFPPEDNSEGDGNYGEEEPETTTNETEHNTTGSSVEN
jgi:hypothetical protein